jgi:hypothetical protein
MYNNIKKFVNPKYATIFLFCVTVLLVIIFMKSRKEPFNKEERDDLRNRFEKKLDKKTDAVNAAIQDTDVIKDLRQNKANKTDLASYATTSQLTSGLGSKLNTADFATKLAADTTKLNTTDFATKLAADTTKLNTADFGSTLAADNTIKGLNTEVGGLKASVSTLNTDVGGVGGVGGLKASVSTLNTDVNNLKTGKLDISTYNTDKSTIPTTLTINTLVNDAVTAQVGMINSAESAYNTASGNFDTNASAKTTAFNDNATAKTTAFNTNANQLTIDFSSNALARTTSFNNNASLKYSEVSALKSAAEDAKTAAEQAKDAAEAAKAASARIYNNVFGQQSTEVITQSNIYRNGFRFNESTGYYESQAESFTTIEGLVSDNTFTQEKKVIQDINAFNAKYYDYLSCKADSSKCPQGKTAAILKSELLALSLTLQTSIATLKNTYQGLSQETDGTQSLLDKAAQIDDLRQDLDAKMAKIIESKNSPNEMTQQLDSTVYAGILWSILGTSLLYYIFTE